MSLAENSKGFLDYLEQWLAALPVLSLEEALPEPEKYRDYHR